MTTSTRKRRTASAKTDAVRWRTIRHYLSPVMTASIFGMALIPSRRGWSTEDWIDAHADAASRIGGRRGK